MCENFKFFNKHGSLFTGAEVSEGGSPDTTLSMSTVSQAVNEKA